MAVESLSDILLSLPVDNGLEHIDADSQESHLADIKSILLVANDLLFTHPRIAYLCCRGASAKACMRDSLIPQIIDSLDGWITRNDDITLGAMQRDEDKDLLIDFYINYYEQHIKAFTEPHNVNQISEGTDQIVEVFPVARDAAGESADQLIKACQTARVIFNVLEAFWIEHVPRQILDANNKVKRLPLSHETYVPSNNLPLDPQSADNAATSDERVQQNEVSHSNGEDILHSEVVPPSLPEILSILGVANELHRTNPGIAYLCCEGALKEALKTDHSARRRSFRQIVVSLHYWIDKNCTAETRIFQLVVELQKFYIEYYEENIKDSTNPCSQLKKTYQIALVLYKVLMLFCKDEELREDEEMYHKIMEARSEVEKLAETFLPYNIRPLILYSQREKPTPTPAPTPAPTPTPTPPPILDSERVPSSLAEISSFIRVADEFHLTEPLVAYLCCWSAAEEAVRLNQFSRGDGVRKFMTSLISWIDENERTTGKYIKPIDMDQMQRFYLFYYTVHIRNLEGSRIEDHPAARDSSHRITKACQNALVLVKVLKIIWRDEDLPHMVSKTVVNQKEKIFESHTHVKKLAQIYKPYNILPLDPLSKDHAIRRFPEIEVVLEALGNKEDLQWPEHHTNYDEEDMLDWLQAMFGFQKDNVSNQREHLILLLANVHSRKFLKEEKPSVLDDRILDTVMDKLLENYKRWCEFLGLKDRKWDNPEKMKPQWKLLFIGLYLLIWGEAANLRFMPECICYIYHHMAEDLFEILSKRQKKSKCGGEDEAFLKKVVTPIYLKIVQKAEGVSGEKHYIGKNKEAEKVSGGKHSKWRNYDDLNEHFWSNQCISRSWSTTLDAADFFAQKDGQDKSKLLIKKVVGFFTAGDGSVEKVNFIEIRSYWHLFRSFDRMWTLYIIGLQSTIIFAWNEWGEVFVFHNILSLFIMVAVLNLVQALVNIALSWNALHSMKSVDEQLKYLLMKLVVALSWIVLFSITYYTHSLTILYLAIAIYLSSSMPREVIFLSSFFGCHHKRLSDNKLVKPGYDKIVKLMFYCNERVKPMSDRILKLVKWWYQVKDHRVYVGRGMRKNLRLDSYVKYMVFWIVLLVLKCGFSYYAEIQPLVGPTKEMMRLGLPALQYHGLVITLWSPIILVYFMDTQIWYAILSTLVGGYIGASRRLGEVQTLGMLRTRFKTLSGVFNTKLVPVSKPDEEETDASTKKGKLDDTRFCQLWNTIITSFREEDLISDGEKELMLVPYWKKMEAKENQDPTEKDDPIRSPLFMLTNKIHMVLEVAKNSNGDYDKLKEALHADIYVTSAVEECYASFKILLNTLVVQGDVQYIKIIFTRIDNYVKENPHDVNWSVLPDLYDQFVQLTDHLEKNTDGVFLISRIVLDMYDVVESRMMKELFEQFHRIPMTCLRRFRLPVGPRIHDWEKNINRLHLLLTFKKSAMDVPSNLEARRRLTFFSNSLFMDIPNAPKIRNMISFSALTPYYSEDVLFSDSILEKQNEDGISILFYLQKVFPDEWKNFLRRVKCDSENQLGDDLKEDLRLWASYRGQTLTRTVRGMMYNRKALELQAFFDEANPEELMRGYEAHKLAQNELSAKCQAYADIKFTYVVSCQQYIIQKRSGHQHAEDILGLMTTYPSLRVAYIDEVEQAYNVNKDGTVEKIYYSALVKAAPELHVVGRQPIKKAQDQVIYRIKLPGKPIIGEGKPENQNHAIIFTRGEALQTIDMNQDNYMEEAFKMRNLLQEFFKDHGDVKNPKINQVKTNDNVEDSNSTGRKKESALISEKEIPTILGLREHIFTGSVSSLAWFMSNQESSFVTLGQRVLANPLKVRFHYGHPDVFDRLFHLTRGGVSKASKTINLSEDIFAGFNSTLRKGNITHHEYIQVGKGRDVGLNQISMFEAKIANGSGEQTLSRDLYRLGNQFDLFRMLSCYFTTVGFYFCSMLTVLTVYTFLYGRLYLALSGLEEEMWNHPAICDTKALQAAFVSLFVVQIGLLMAFPMIVVIGLERGFHNALFDFVLMQLQLAPVFFTFQLGTKFHYYSKTLMHGGAEYKATGRGFVVLHAKFAENYRLYSRSHFVKAFELMILLLVYHMFRHAYMGVVTYMLVTFSIWFMVGSWLFAPYLFNPSGFEWHKIVDDWTDWKKWIYEYDFGVMGVLPEKGWESWWEKEQEHLQHSGIYGAFLEIVLALRFFIFLAPFGNNQSIQVRAALWWLMIMFLMFILVDTSLTRQLLGKNFQFFFRAIKALVFLILLVILITFIALRLMTLQDMFLCMMGLIQIGWGTLLIAQALKRPIKWLGLWSFVRKLAWSYDLLMGFLLFVPLALLAWFPFVSEFQTRILFNPAFSRGLQVSHILRGQSFLEQEVTKNKE